MSKSASSSRRTALAAAFLVLVICQIVTSAPAYDDDYIRSLLDFIKQEAPHPYVHQMERKGGRSPTLRLRFGRRSDPLWSKMMVANSQQDDEQAPYK